MWSVSAKPKTLRVTRQLAQEFAEMEPAPHDRPLNERRLMVYERALKAGGFRPVAWAKCYCKETGATYRVNGKHTSTLLATIAELPEFYATVESYEADTLEDVARLYATFDSRSQVRTTSDINRTFAATVPELARIGRSTIDLLVSGISYERWQDQYAHTPATERAELLLDHIDFASWFCSTIGEKRGNESLHLHRAPVVGAMLATWKRSQKDCTRFWVAVRDETGAHPTMPDRKLARWLLQWSVNLGNGAKSIPSRKAAPREFFVKSLHAWNAWRKGQTTDLKYFPQARVPTAL